jgi:hypothetical protein
MEIWGNKELQDSKSFKDPGLIHIQHIDEIMYGVHTQICNNFICNTIKKTRKYF